MKWNYTDQPYASNRFSVMAKNGMVATGNALASSAGLRILLKGGNAVDAAIATAAALTVVEPTANGIGSDAFAIVWMKDQLYGLNGSGFAPQMMSINAVKKKHENTETMPKFGWTPVMVPGAPKTWAALNQRFGKLTLLECLEPAIEYAKEGFPVAPETARGWKRSVGRYPREEAEFKEWYKTFTIEGRAPKAAELFKMPDHAATLEEIGKTNAESFYSGHLADKIDACSKKFNGFLRKEDLMKYDVEWVEPIRMEYRGYEVCEIPPNGQGILALMALNTLKNFEFSHRLNAIDFHRQFEAMKMAFVDGKSMVTDPSFMKVSVEKILSKKTGETRASMINETASEVEPLDLAKSGTVYLCTADKEGNMVSYIQSNYMGFGSGIVVEDTGISLQNRGADFSLDENHINALLPGKKTYHTIIPGFLMKDGKAVGPFGVMGGTMQPQGHLQVVMNLIDYNLNPQMALDAPRWQYINGKKFVVESSFDTNVAKQLKEMGHEVEIALENGGFGRGQIIVRLENGMLVGACESRTDSLIACY